MLATVKQRQVWLGEPKFTVQDVEDGIYDSAVFLKADSLGTPPTIPLDGKGGQTPINISSGRGTKALADPTT